MTAVLQLSVQLVQHACSECHAEYAIPQRLDQQAHQKGVKWFCPHGHVQMYAENEVAKLTRQLDQAKRDIEQERSFRHDAEKEAKSQRAVAKRERTMRKGLEQRARGGLCPCCKRSFEDLRRHMATKHPDFGHALQEAAK